MTNKLGPYDLNSIITGDARELAEAIPDESVDLIFTDPVYDRIDDYRWLAETAARVLRPDRACLVWIGIGYLPEIATALSEYLDYRWQFIGYYTNQVSPSRVPYGFSKYISLLWFDKGKVKCPRGIDLLPSPVFNDINYNGGKINHIWSKPTKFYKYNLSLFTHPNDIVFDPFTGGGTVPAVCKMLGRNYLAFEVDPATAEAARERVLLTQPPLFVPEPEQLALLEVV